VWVRFFSFLHLLSLSSYLSSLFSLYSSSSPMGDGRSEKNPTRWLAGQGRRRHRVRHSNPPFLYDFSSSHSFLSPNPDFRPKILKIWTYHPRSYEIQIKKRFTSSLRFLHGSGTAWLVVTRLCCVGLNRRLDVYLNGWLWCLNSFGFWIDGCGCLL